MLTIAIPKGRLFEQVQQTLASAGSGFALRHPRDYTPICADPSLSLRVFKPRAIPQLVALGRYDVGFCGFDLLEEGGYDDAVSVLDLGLNRVSLVVAASASTPDILSSPPKRPLVIATEYPRIAEQWALERGLAHIAIQTWGSTEGYVPRDADLAFDVCETGETLRANGLVILETLFSSTTRLIANRQALAHPSTGNEIRAFAKKISTH